ncbi:MAG: exo-alpha-sialidase, partial [Bacteroidetes bacterium]|nr:exo-alpha-sialidase [Bacteroidota bacterium]
MKHAPSLIIMAFLLIVTTSYAQKRDVNPEWEQTIKRRLHEMMEEKLHSHEFEQHAGGRANKRAVQIGSEVEVSGHARSESEIHAAINPTDTTNIVIAPIQEVSGGGSMGGGQLALPLYITTDFGQTWTTSTFSGGGGGGGDPVLAFAADGTLYFSWLHLTQSGFSMSISLLFASSTNGGFTWSAVDTIDSGTMSMMGAGRMVDKQWMAVDKSNSSRKGTLYTIYVLMEMQGMSQNMAIAMKYKEPDSSRFDETVIQLTDASFSDMQFPSVNVDATGTVHAFWWGTKNGVSGLWHRSSSDGRTFGSTHQIATVRFPQQGNNTSVPNHLPQRLGVMPQFEVDNHSNSPNQGTLYAVWNANDPGPGAGSYNEPFHVFFAASSNGGSSWSVPKRIDDLTVDNTHQFHPSLSVNPNGVVIATWYDGRDDTMNTAVHYYTAISTDRGATWSQNARISTRSSNMSASIQGRFGIGDYDKALSTSFYAIPIWSDGR